uniref:Odorant binding protein n=1 Tax=Dendrolimus kikuchii TaxID=765133 RepID=A0A076E952_9NEOP|nr:odorant binding protein [Dendrolimus kikuchii]
MLHCKTTVLVFVFVSTVYADMKRPFQFPKERIDNFMNTASTCNKELNTNIDVSELFKGKYDQSESFKDSFYCIAVNSGFYDANGWPKLEKLYEIYKDEDVRTVLKDCTADLDGERPKDLASNYLICFLVKAPITVIF